MIYDETGLEMTIHYKGYWDAGHTIVKPTWKDILILAGAKLFGLNTPPLKFNQKNLPNALMNEGEQEFIELFFRNNASFGAGPFHFGLGNNGGSPGIPAETATLSTITEVSGSGYARVSVARGTTDWGAATLDSGDYQTTSATKSFNATGNWTAADYLFLTDVSSGTSGNLIAAVALSASRTLVNGDRLDVSMIVKIQ